MQEYLTVYTLSDVSTETAESVARAAAMPFVQPIKLIPLPRLVEVSQISEVLQQMTEQPALLIHSIGQSDLRRGVNEEVKHRQLRAVDVLDAPIAEISSALRRPPQTGELQQRDELYFKRIEAIEFAIDYDDCKDPRGLLDAEVILVGVSRSSKTPTCMYLAQNRGIKTANVPIHKDVMPPQELFDIPPGRIVGLTIQPLVLHRIRIARLHALGLTESANYVNLESIKAEHEYAKTLFRRLRCPVVDVTNKAIEETASEILEITNRKETFV